MKRVLIIVEGVSEKEFVDLVLSPYLLAHGVSNVQCFKIKHSKGGLTKYDHLKKDILNAIYETDVIISTLIDFYALPIDFPEYAKFIGLNHKAEVVEKLENAIVDDISETFGDVSNKLFPYIQLHEFEAFVFASDKVLFDFYSENEANLSELKGIVSNYPNPEEINQGKTSAPSKRLINAIPGYSKVNHGIAIIKESGIDTILEKCPRFRSWVKMLIEKANKSIP